ncbi:MAG TPA: PTS sugar transporter subunit IIA [Chlamydiales bacterium]|nr:PTS sugar transporter subunit IIA [Chlamydiales bacterium]
MAIPDHISPLRLDIFKPLRKKQHQKICQSLDPKLIGFLNAQTRDEAIGSLIDLLAQTGKVPDKASFRDAIFHRENLLSTAIGMGVSIPHAKMKSFSEFLVAVGIQKKKGVDWQALDEIPVRIIFMIGGPEDKQSEYLQILSQITSAIKNVELRKALLIAQSPEQVVNLFSDF